MHTLLLYFLQLKSEDLVKSFVARITQVNGILNAVVDERYAAALEEARAADKLIESGEWTSENLQRARPFHGIPFTTKDSTAIKGWTEYLSFYHGIFMTPV